jgi:hypothetical protein
VLYTYSIGIAIAAENYWLKYFGKYDGMDCTVVAGFLEEEMKT